MPLVAPSAPADCPASPPKQDDALAGWVALARCTLEACLVIDADVRIVAVSASAATLLGLPPAAPGHRRPLTDVVEVLDFQQGPAAVASARIAPVMAAHHEVLCRGLFRIRRRDGEQVTIDAVATPIHGQHHELVGSASFLAAV